MLPANHQTLSQGLLNIFTPTCVLLDKHGAFGTTLKSFYPKRTGTCVDVENAKSACSGRPQHRENRRSHFGCRRAKRTPTGSSPGFELWRSSSFVAHRTFDPHLIPLMLIRIRAIIHVGAETRPSWGVTGFRRFTRKRSCRS